MGNLGLPEIAFIFILALLIFGPKKLPEIGRTVGKGVAEFRKATNELKRTINTELALEESPTPPQLRARRLEMETPVEPVEAPMAAPPMTEPRSAAMDTAAATVPEAPPPQDVAAVEPSDPQPAPQSIDPLPDPE